MEAIKDAFVKADPENKEYYEKILKTMSKSLTILTENTEKNWRSIQKRILLWDIRLTDIYARNTD